jgi:hypothetical protein
VTGVASKELVAAVPWKPRLIATVMEGVRYRVFSVRFGASAHDPRRVLAGIQPLAFVRDELFLDVRVHP